MSSVSQRRLGRQRNVHRPRRLRTPCRHPTHLSDGQAPCREAAVAVEELPVDLPAKIKSLGFVQDATGQEKTLVVKVPKTGDFRKELSKYLIDQNLVPLSIQEKSLSLEEAFVTITKENIDLFAGIGGEK